MLWRQFLAEFGEKNPPETLKIPCFQDLLTKSPSIPCPLTRQSLVNFHRQRAPIPRKNVRYRMRKAAGKLAPRSYPRAMNAGELATSGERGGGRGPRLYHEIGGKMKTTTLTNGNGGQLVQGCEDYAEAVQTQTWLTPHPNLNIRRIVVAVDFSESSR